MSAGRQAPGDAQGGGIWNGVLLSGPPVELTLDDTLVTHNIAHRECRCQRAGGGVFTTSPITLRQSPIVLNAPDSAWAADGSTRAGPASAQPASNN
jgi:hypothetical protein